MDPLSRLGRKDKWFLGGGSGAVYAPPFPKWLLTPGFWDECHFSDIRIDRLFTVLICKRGKPLRFSSYLKGWRPDRLTIMHVAGDVVIREIRCVTGSNVWVSQLELVTDVGELDAFLWTLHRRNEPGAGSPWRSCDNYEATAGRLSCEYRIAWPDEVAIDRSGFDSAESDSSIRQATGGGSIFLAYGADAEAKGICLLTSEVHDESPNAAIAPISEFFRDGKLREGPGVSGYGLIHTLQHYRLCDKRTLQFACSAALSRNDALKQLDSAISSDAVAGSQQSWRDYFTSVPIFECSDDCLTNHYWYRWYGLRLQTVDVRLPKYPFPCVFEGIDAFRNLISYSAPCHIRETAWMHDPSLARGILRNFAFNQREDGSFPGHIYSFRPDRDFYHANWGDAVMRLHRIHSLADAKAEILECLERYAAYLQNQRDPDRTGLISVWDQNETGQEYSSRYLFADERADQWGKIDLKGVDATYYAWRLRKALDSFESRSNDLDRCEAALQSLWDDGNGIYKDALLNPFRLSPHMSAVGFYPLEQFDVDDKSLELSLFNTNHFATPYRVPTSPTSDPFFSAEPLWKSKRMNCPWNGRVWPMANSHIAESLANMASRNPKLRTVAGQFLMQWLRMMTFDGNPHRPNCFEHYNPITGEPSAYRGIDDYMHSWIVDLIIRHVCGIDPSGVEGQTIDCGLDWWSISKVPTGIGFIEREWKRMG